MQPDWWHIHAPFLLLCLLRISRKTRNNLHFSIFLINADVDLVTNYIFKTIFEIRIHNYRPNGPLSGQHYVLTECRWWSLQGSVSVVRRWYISANKEFAALRYLQPIQVSLRQVRSPVQGGDYRTPP